MKTTTVSILLLFATLALAENWRETQRIELPVAGLDTLIVNCGAGLLNIKGVDASAKIDITAEIEVIGLEKEKRQQFIQENLRLILEKQRHTARLKSEFQKDPPNGVEARINLTVVIPRAFNVNISDGSGNIRVRSLHGNLIIVDGSGDIAIENIVGTVTAHDGSGSILIEDISGNVRVKDGSGRIEIDNVKGDVYVADGSGDMEIQYIDGNVSISDTSGEINISDVSKNVFISEAGSGELNIERIGGKVTYRD